MAQSSITLESPDGTKTVTLKLENDGYLYIRSGSGENKGARRIYPDHSEPQYD
jgi:hypothetical protein